MGVRRDAGGPPVSREVELDGSFLLRAAKKAFVEWHEGWMEVWAGELARLDWERHVRVLELRAAGLWCDWEWRER